MKKVQRVKTMAQVVREAKKTYRENGKSWTKASRKMGVSRGTLIRVTQGYEPKVPHIRRAFGLNVFVTVPTCLKCGQAHVSKRCTQKKTFEQNCAEYDAWLASPTTQQALARMLAWSETPKSKRPKYAARTP